MASFEEILQNYVNSDYNTLVGLAKQALVDILPACKAVDPEHEGFFVVTSIILAGIGADGVLTGLEKKFLSDVLGQDEATIQKFIGLYSSKMAELVDKFADASTTEIKSKLLVLVTAVAAVDEKISYQETALLRKILE